MSEINKPAWAALLREVLDMEKVLDRVKDLSLDMRCSEQVRALDGARCSADKYPEHEHRWDRGDLL